MNVSFTVHGTPQPQGSTRAFIPKGWKRAVVTTDNSKLKPWRQAVAAEALAAMEGQPLCSGAVIVNCRFLFLKPKSVKKSVVDKLTKPDVDKLVRGIFDALSGICFRDDAQIVRSCASKEFCESNERAEIEVFSWTDKNGIDERG